MATVLIADDDRSARSTMQALLFKEGYDLAFACDGPEALTQAAELMPDVILLDVMMPDMDGFEVCRRLRADPLLAEVPIIMVTALNDQESLMQGIEAGADDFVSKPFNRAELRARVRTITRLNRYRRLLGERAKFEWVVKQAQDGYLMLDGGDHIRYANPQARLYLGLPAVHAGPSGRNQDVLVAETFLELAHKQYQCEPREAWETWPEPCATPETSPRFLVRSQSPTANAFWLKVTILDLPSEPEADRVVCLQDVTAHMASQRDMHGFHEMVRHKLRTPVVNVLGSLELLARHATKLSSAEVAQFSEVALKGVRRLHSEVEDIIQYLDASTPAQSGTGFDLTQLHSLIAEISADLGLESVVMSGHEGLSDARLALSRRDIELVLWEVLENAKKFHPKQAPTVEILVSPLNSEQIRIRFADDGLTLLPEQLTQVWTPYYQGEKNFTGELPGMGLGLTMIAALVWSVGGEYRLYNRVQGPGVVLELDLPRR